MNKARNRFILFAEITIIILLTVLLSVINILNFSMAEEDADMITERIARSHGIISEKNKPENAPQSQDSDAQKTDDNSGFRGGYRIYNDRHDIMGPESKDMDPSLRFFTYSFDKDGNSKQIAYRISAVTEEQAEEWAESLIASVQSGAEKDKTPVTGWTNMTYRYRIYEEKDTLYVTVVDQSRELWPSYRLLIISIIGGASMMVISFFLLLILGKKLFRPVEEADRKQKLFIAKLESEFKTPLTVINADTEVLEREGGGNDQTRSINKQVKRMTRLVKELSALAIFEDKSRKNAETDLSELLNVMIDMSKPVFEEKNISLECEIEPSVKLKSNEEAVSRMLRELMSNSEKFSLTKCRISLTTQKGRTKLVFENDAELPDGSCDQIFDRFITLSNAAENEGSGLGLSYVKDFAISQNGRVSASVKNKMITIAINF